MTQNATATASKQATGFHAIVPGDRIANRKKDTFDEWDLFRALDKRYRGSPCFDETDNHVVREAMKMDRINDAVEHLKDYLVKREGHDRNVILTQEELKERSARSNRLGIIQALLKQLANPSTELEIKRVLRQQVGMRKLEINPERLGDTVLRRLTDKKYLSYSFKMENGREIGIWKLRPSVNLTEDQILELYPQSATA